jgi:protein O-mannosyl-transferase
MVRRLRRLLPEDRTEPPYAKLNRIASNAFGKLIDYALSNRKSDSDLQEMQNADLKSLLLARWKIVVCAIAFLCYAQTLAFPFVYDDKYLISRNVYITSFRYLPQFFTSHLWDSINLHMVNYYRPLLLIWSLLNYKLFGLNPIGWHVTNVLLHVLATYLVCLLAEKFTRDRGIGILAGIIFAVHPVHIEVVAWASAASEMLLAIFVIGSLICYMAALEEQKGRRRVLWSLLLYIGALLSKEPAAMMPAVIFLFVWLERDKEEGFANKALASLKAAAPFLLIVCIYYGFRLILFGREHYTSFDTLSATTMVHTWPLLFCFYLKLLVFPFDLSPLYDIPAVDSITQVTFIVPVLLIGLIAIAVLLRLRRDRSKVVLFAILWLIWLLPAFYIRAFSVDRKASDRYLYLPSVGFCILLGAALRRVRVPRRELLGIPAGQGAAALIVVATLTTGALFQEIYWSSDLLLFYRALKIAPRNDMSKEDLGVALMRDGHFAQAVPLLLDAVQHKPERWSLLSSLGISYYHLGSIQKRLTISHVPSRSIRQMRASTHTWALLC